MLIVAYISSVVGVGARVGVGACFFVDVDTPRSVSYTHLTLPTIYSV